jgi:hypothetical protein
MGEEQLRDASEIVEHYTTTVYTDMIYDCDEYRGLVQSNGCTNAPNSVAPQKISIPSLPGLQTDTTNSIQIIVGNKQNSINNVDQIQEPTDTTRPITKRTITAQTHVNNKYLQYKEPLTYKQSQTYSDRIGWEEATQRELQQLDDLETMLPIKLEEVPGDANITKSKIVYTLKLLPNGDIEKYKARIVAKGYTQEYRVDYTEKCSPKPQITGIRFVLKSSEKNQWRCE